MPTRTPPRPPADSKPIEFLFLVSHGLLSPISAVRWGTGRLKRLAKDMTPEQRQIVDHVHVNAKRLSTAFTSMLLLARNEDQTYTSVPERLPVSELLALFTDSDHASGLSVQVSCPDTLFIEGDKAILEAVFHNIFAVLGEALTEPRTAAVEVDADAAEVSIIISCSLELSVQNVRAVGRETVVRPVVGGTPGLLLSLSSSLMGFAGGSLDMRGSDDGKYRLTVRVPRAR